MLFLTEAGELIMELYSVGALVFVILITFFIELYLSKFELLCSKAVVKK